MRAIVVLKGSMKANARDIQEYYCNQLAQIASTNRNGGCRSGSPLWLMKGKSSCGHSVLFKGSMKATAKGYRQVIN
jgi:hypothetical protein